MSNRDPYSDSSSRSFISCASRRLSTWRFGQAKRSHGHQVIPGLDKRFGSFALKLRSQGIDVDARLGELNPCTPYVNPLVLSLNGTPPTKPRKPFDQSSWPAILIL
jgi:hypothetical protein